MLINITSFLAAGVILIVGRFWTPDIVFGIALWGIAFGGAATQLQTAISNASGENADIANYLLGVAFNFAIFVAGVLGAVLITAAGGLAPPLVMATVPLIAFAVALTTRISAFPATRSLGTRDEVRPHLGSRRIAGRSVLQKQLVPEVRRALRLAPTMPVAASVMTLNSSSFNVSCGGRRYHRASSVSLDGDLPCFSIGGVTRSNPSFQATNTSIGAVSDGEQVTNSLTTTNRKLSEPQPAWSEDEIVSMFTAQGHRGSRAAPEPILTPPGSGKRGLPETTPFKQRADLSSLRPGSKGVTGSHSTRKRSAVRPTAPTRGRQQSPQGGLSTVEVSRCSVAAATRSVPARGGVRPRSMPGVRRPRARRPDQRVRLKPAVGHGPFIREGLNGLMLSYLADLARPRRSAVDGVC